VQRFREGLVFKAHRLVYHSTLGLRVIQKKKKKVRAARQRARKGPIEARNPYVPQNLRAPHTQCQNHYFAEMCSGFEAGSYFRLIDLCITQL